MGPIVTIHKEKDKREIDYQPEVMKLNRSGIVLWMYFMRYDSMQTVQVHYKDLLERGQIDKQEYIKGFKNLEDNYFIIPRIKSVTKREYDFYAEAHVRKIQPKVVKQEYKIAPVIKKDVESEELKTSKQSIEKFGF